MPYFQVGTLRHCWHPSTASATSTHRRKAQQSAYSDFRAWRAALAEHPSAEYFIYKSIILNNLFGVDIMEEATEICRLRLFLKLVAQVEPDPDKPNLGIEPLPDIDFNIRAGNTLVGFTSIEEVRKSQEGKLGLAERDIQEIETTAAAVDVMFRKFREAQTTVKPDSEQMAVAKHALRDAIAGLNDRLDRFLAGEYGIDADSPKQGDAFENWRKSHQPFHWITEFYGIMSQGGFGVIIGNPPYVEYVKIVKQYRLLADSEPFHTNLYSACCARADDLLSCGGYSSFIVPVSLPSTDRMMVLRDRLLSEHSVYHTSFSTRPSKLFEGAEQRLTIFIQTPLKPSTLWSGGYLKWYAGERQSLFALIHYVQSPSLESRNRIWPKLRGELERSTFWKIRSHGALNATRMLAGSKPLYYKNTGLRYFSTVTLRPPRCWINGEATSSSRETVLNVAEQYWHAVHALLLSTTFFYHYQVTSNCRDLNPSDIELMPVPALDRAVDRLDVLSRDIEEDYTRKGKILRMENKRTGTVELESVTPSRSKPIIDEIDGVLAEHYGFTAEELDFIVNYDIKYRLGTSATESNDA